MDRDKLKKEKDILQKKLEVLEEQEEQLRKDYATIFTRLKEIEHEERHWITIPAK